MTKPTRRQFIVRVTLFELIDVDGIDGMHELVEDELYDSGRLSLGEMLGNPVYSLRAADLANQELEIGVDADVVPAEDVINFQ